MENVKLDDAIPLASYGRPLRWPTLYWMNTGQSFEIKASQWQSVRMASVRCRRKTGRTFSIRKVSDIAFRVWRLT